MDIGGLGCGMQGKRLEVDGVWGRVFLLEGGAGARIFLLLFQHCLDKPHHLILTEVEVSQNSKKSNPVPYKMVHGLFKILGGGGDFHWGGEIPGCPPPPPPPPPLCMKPCGVLGIVVYLPFTTCSAL